MNLFKLGRVNGYLKKHIIKLRGICHRDCDVSRDCCNNYAPKNTKFKLCRRRVQFHFLLVRESIYFDHTNYAKMHGEITKGPSFHVLLMGKIRLDPIAIANGGYVSWFGSYSSVSFKVV